MSHARRREATPASIPAVARGDELDVAGLPSYGFGTRSLMWWDTVAMCAIEGTAFGFMIVVYFHLRSLSQAWPAGGAAPDPGWGTLNLLIILLSAIPNWLRESFLAGPAVGSAALSALSALVIAAMSLPTWVIGPCVR